MSVKRYLPELMHVRAVFHSLFLWHFSKLLEISYPLIIGCSLLRSPRSVTWSYRPLTTKNRKARSLEWKNQVILQASANWEKAEKRKRQNELLLLSIVNQSLPTLFWFGLLYKCQSRVDTRRHLQKWEHILKG